MDQLVYEHEGRTVPIPLEGKPVSIGRAPEADHQLPSKGASRIHAQVFKRDGAWMVEDLGSSNGTFLNLVKIGGPTPLKPGDVIGIADMRLTFDGTPPAPPEGQLARLVYTPEPGQPAIETLIQGKVSIGRKPGNTLIIDHKAVSSHHCEIEKRESGYFVRDLDSSNGTFVGEHQVTEQQLRNGDILVIGKAVKVYFIDPAAQPAPVAQAAPVAVGAPPPMPPVQPVWVSPHPVVSAAPPSGGRTAINLAAGATVAALFILAGWLVAGLITDSRNPASAAPDNAPAPMVADNVLSFEGRVDQHGNPEGWVASFEAPNNATVQLVADAAVPVDGAFCLSATSKDIGGAVATLALQTVAEKPLGFGTGMQAALHVRGEGVTSAAFALCAVDENDRVRMLGCRPLGNVLSTQWSVYPLLVTATEPLPASARLRIMISGNFSRLWLDRFEMAAADEEPAITPFAKLAPGGFQAAAPAARPGEISVAAIGGSVARFAPRLLDAENREVSEAELWCLARTGANDAGFRAMLPRRGEIRVMDVRAFEQPSPALGEKGLHLTWRLSERAASSLAVSVTLPLPKDANILLADRRGAPLEVSRTTLHAFAYSTISEIAVEGSGFSLVFPLGAVAWFDMARPGELGLTLRAAPESARDSLEVGIYTRPVMHARLFERVYADGMRWLDDSVRNYSAALARFEWLTAPGRSAHELPVLLRARERVAEIDTIRTQRRAAIDTAWQAALNSRTREALDACEKLLRQYLNEFSADAIGPEYRLNLGQVERWQRESAAIERTPEERRMREAVARSLYEAADTKFKDKNYLLTLIMLENVLRDYADSETARDARVLYDQVQKLINDPEVRDKEIDARLAEVDDDIKFKRYALARNTCLKLFKRFPDSPRSREIMQRLRAIESAYE